MPLHWAAAGIDEVCEEAVKRLCSDDPHRLTKAHCDGCEDFDGYAPIRISCVSEKPNLNLLSYFSTGNPGSFDASVDRNNNFENVFVDGCCP